MLFILDKILSFLPANRWKTIVGFILVSIPQIVPGFPVGEAQTLITAIGQVIMSLGLIHKAVKNVNGTN